MAGTLRGHSGFSWYIAGVSFLSCRTQGNREPSLHGKADGQERKVRRAGCREKYGGLPAANGYDEFHDAEADRFAAVRRRNEGKNGWTRWMRRERRRDAACPGSRPTAKESVTARPMCGFSGPTAAGKRSSCRNGARKKIPSRTATDISSAGHIPAGLGFRESARKELEEELGVTAADEDLHYCGRKSFQYDGTFYGEPFHDRQVTAIYYLVDDRPAEDFRIQRSELSEVRWFGLDECLRLVHEYPTQQADGAVPPAAEAGKPPAFLHCIIPEELELVAAAYRRNESGRNG
jgi:8-oxo-dGTP pyrophosphatase MutT (NUDIX family)